VSGDHPHRRKSLPLSQSILWAPGTAAPPSPARGEYALFLHQRALTALHDHLRNSPDKGVLGFLLGHLYVDPPSGQRFAVIELVMRLTVAIYGDKTTVVVSRVWDKMQEELTRTGAQLLGWYHSHPPAGIELAAGDLETHATYFGEPWQAALVVGVGEQGPVAGLYRPHRGADAGPQLAFYELLDPRSVAPDGKKRSSVRWTNFKPHRPGGGGPRSGPVPAVPDVGDKPAAVSFVPAERAAPPPLSASSPASPAPAGPPARSAPPAPTSQAAAPAGVTRSGRVPAVHPSGQPSSEPRRRSSRPQPRFVLGDQPRARSRPGLVAALLALVVLGGGAGWYFLLGPGAAPTPSAPPAPGVPADTAPSPAPADTGGGGTPGAADTSAVPVSVPNVAPPVGLPAPAAPPAGTARFDRVGDSLVTAIQAYQDESRRYEGGLTDCTGLARGLVAVETAFTSYSGVRGGLAASLDGTRTQRDVLLNSTVDSVEAHYTRTGCRRP
jgi:hypothetical protein